jgi:hypothetical protein
MTWMLHVHCCPAEAWLKKKGKTRVEGPQSFSIYDSVGFEVLGE